MTRLIVTMTAALTFAAVHSASAQSLADLRKLYDAGQYQQVVAAAAAHPGSPEEQPRIVFLSGQAQQKLSKRDEARQAYELLASRPESDPWHDIGASAVAMLASNAGAAVDAATQAVAHGDSLPEAHFQQGLALGLKQDMSAAAAAFEKATQLDPSWADAHYYAGIAYSKIKRIDQTALHFDTFLRLAPQSPQRPEVQSIMRTLSGK